MDSLEIAVFGGGCFWCTEAIFKNLNGVEDVRPGYAGGTSENPNYFRHSDHVEVVQVEFNPEIISYQELLTVFFGTHDPTSVDRQGNDVGHEYSSLILYSTESQRNAALKYIAELENDGTIDEPIVTKVEPLGRFYEAEEFHQNFYERNHSSAYCRLVIDPKLHKLREKFSNLLISQTK